MALPRSYQFVCGAKKPLDPTTTTLSRTNSDSSFCSAFFAQHMHGNKTFPPIDPLSPAYPIKFLSAAVSFPLFLVWNFFFFFCIRARNCLRRANVWRAWSNRLPMWIKCYDSTVLSNFSFDFNLTAYIGKCCSGSEVRTNTLFDRKSEVRKRSSLYNSFFLFSFLGSPLFVTEVERPDLLIRGLTRLVRKKRRKPTPAQTWVGVLNSALLFWYPDHFSFSRKRIGGKTVLSGAKKKIRLYLFLFSEEESNVCEIGHSVFTTFIILFAPRGPHFGHKPPHY